MVSGFRVVIALLFLQRSANWHKGVVRATFVACAFELPAILQRGRKRSQIIFKDKDWNWHLDIWRLGGLLSYFLFQIEILFNCSTILWNYIFWNKVGERKKSPPAHRSWEMWPIVLLFMETKKWFLSSIEEWSCITPVKLNNFSNVLYICKPLKPLSNEDKFIFGTFVSTMTKVGWRSVTKPLHHYNDNLTQVLFHQQSTGPILDCP